MHLKISIENNHNRIIRCFIIHDTEEKYIDLNNLRDRTKKTTGSWSMVLNDQSISITSLMVVTVVLLNLDAIHRIFYYYYITTFSWVWTSYKRCMSWQPLMWCWCTHAELHITASEIFLNISNTYQASRYHARHLCVRVKIHMPHLFAQLHKKKTGMCCSRRHPEVTNLLSVWWLT